MDLSRLLGLLSSLRLEPNMISSLGPLIGQVGARGVVAMARAYLGPVAYEVEARWCRERGMSPCERVGVPDVEEPPPPREDPPPGTEPPPPEPPPSNSVPEVRTTFAGLEPAELAILGMAINKLLYEAGELALHNPTVASDGRHPEFKLDANGSPPAISLSHIVAATRALRGPTVVDDEPLTPSTRNRMQQARAERYASANRFSLPSTSTANRLR